MIIEITFHCSCVRCFRVLAEMQFNLIKIYNRIKYIGTIAEV